MFDRSAPDHISEKFRDLKGARDAEAMPDPTVPVSFQQRGGRDAGPCHCFSEEQSLDAMPTELAPTVAEDSTLPLFAVPADIRHWGLRVRLIAAR